LTVLAHARPFELPTRARVAAADFRFLVGEELVSPYEATPGTHRGFCKVCGAPVLVTFDEHSRSAQIDPGAVALYGVALATLDDDPGVRADARTRLLSTRRRGSRSPTICPNTRRVSPARTLPTILDRPITRDCGSRRHVERLLVVR
jgi:hypothetical protein